jgi:hypothetical protein
MKEFENVNQSATALSLRVDGSLGDCMVMDVSSSSDIDIL